MLSTTKWIFHVKERNKNTSHNKINDTFPNKPQSTMKKKIEFYSINSSKVNFNKIYYEGIQKLSFSLFSIQGAQSLYVNIPVGMMYISHFQPFRNSRKILRN